MSDAAEGEFCGLATCVLDADGEPNVGITLTLNGSGSSAWLGWDDTVALHMWLTELMEVSRAQ